MHPLVVNGCLLCVPFSLCLSFATRPDICGRVRSCSISCLPQSVVYGRVQACAWRGDEVQGKEKRPKKAQNYFRRSSCAVFLTGLLKNKGRGMGQRHIKKWKKMNLELAIPQHFFLEFVKKYPTPWRKRLPFQSQYATAGTSFMGWNNYTRHKNENGIILQPRMRHFFFLKNTQCKGFSWQKKTPTSVWALFFSGCFASTDKPEEEVHLYIVGNFGVNRDIFVN